MENGLNLKNYSQNEEQKHILKYFDKVDYSNSIRKPCFLDIGANDGVLFSNTYALALMGWEGVMVEPSTAYARLRENMMPFPKIITLNAAITSRVDWGNFYSSEASELLSSIDGKMAEERGVKTTEHPVRYENIKSLLAINWHIPNFDFISIDTEGNELEILEQINLSQTRTSLICVEKNNHRKEIIEHCLKFGEYKIIYESGENIILGL